jgi:hypothetical protein
VPSWRAGDDSRMLTFCEHSVVGDSGQ